jgi:hypothetical protein
MEKLSLSYAALCYHHFLAALGLKNMGGALLLAPPLLPGEGAPLIMAGIGGGPPPPPPEPPLLPGAPGPRRMVGGAMSAARGSEDAEDDAGGRRCGGAIRAAIGSFSAAPPPGPADDERFGVETELPMPPPPGGGGGGGAAVAAAASTGSSPGNTHRPRALSKYASMSPPTSATAASGLSHLLTCKRGIRRNGRENKEGYTVLSRSEINESTAVNQSKFLL